MTATRRHILSLPLRVLFLAAALLLAFSQPVEAASFASAWKDFHALVKNEKKNKYRSYWLDLEKQFVSIYKKNPSGADAPKALYYAGRVYEELGLRSYLKSDFEKAVDYFERVVKRFPKHSWSDDSLLRKAAVERNNLHDLAAARSDLNRILLHYTKGDMWPRAKKELREVIALMEGGDAQPTQIHAAAEPAPETEPEPAAKAESAKDAKRASRASQLERSTLEKIRYQSSDEYTRVVLDLSDEAPYRYQILDPVPSLNKPYRLYVDLETAQVGQGVQSSLDIADGILRRVRVGQHDHQTARVVLDFQDLQKYQIFALENPYRIVIDVSAPEKRTASSVAPQKQKPAAASSKPKPLQTAQNTKKPEKYTLKSESKKQSGNLIEQLGLTVDTIMIDPGHGGKDPGAVGHGGVLEKDVNLRFAKVLGRLLEERGFTVLYTRTKDSFVPLEERTAMANVQKADLFISVHCNAFRSPKLNGLETYYLDLANSEDAVRVAARENSMSAKRISDLQYILTDLMLNSKMKESKDLANSVHSNLVSELRKNYQIRDHGVRTAPFYVLMGAKMPSILVELGYITNPEEAKRMKSTKYLERKAKGLVDGVTAYKKQIERFASL